MKTLSILFVFFATSSVAITIFNHKPKDTIHVGKGVEKFELSCHSDVTWNHCEFFHEKSQKSCKVFWNGQNIERKKCRQKHGIKYIGGRRGNWCNVEIKVQGDISGQWTCKLSDDNSNAIEHFNVEIQGEEMTAKKKATDNGTNGTGFIRDAILVFTFGITLVLVVGCVILLSQSWKLLKN